MLASIIIMLGCQLLLQLGVCALLELISAPIHNGAQHIQGQGHPIDSA
tara:strand:+ start:4860 stop:5003 length:144 start_codon:yes stop_codon:yes gene_type:complete